MSSGDQKRKFTELGSLRKYRHFLGTQEESEGRNSYHSLDACFVPNGTLSTRHATICTVTPVMFYHGFKKELFSPFYRYRHQA